MGSPYQGAESQLQEQELQQQPNTFLSFLIYDYPHSEKKAKRIELQDRTAAAATDISDAYLSLSYALRLEANLIGSNLS